MNIEIFVSKTGKVAFTCHGRFKKRISQIVADRQTGQIRIIFKPDLEIMTLNCNLSEDLCKIVENQLFCAMGYFNNGKLEATEYVRFMCQ